VVPEPEDEGQTPETHLDVAPPSGGPPGGAPDGPRLSLLRLAVPLHSAPPPAPPPPPPLPAGSLFAGGSGVLRRPHAAPGRAPPLPVPQQTPRGAACDRGGPLPLRRPLAPPRLVSVPPLPALGAGAAAESQSGGPETEPAPEPQGHRTAWGSGAEGRDGVKKNITLNLVSKTLQSRQAAAPQRRHGGGDVIVTPRSHSPGFTRLTVWGFSRHSYLRGGGA